MKNQDAVFSRIIQQETQLLVRTDPLDILSDLIDDEFVEFGSSGTIYDKTDIIDWSASDDPSERAGQQFKARYLSDDVILLTYISSIKENPSAVSKQALRSSIWRSTEGRWRMVFHQGTPIR